MIFNQAQLKAWWDHVFRSVEQDFRPLTFDQFRLRTLLVKF